MNSFDYTPALTIAIGVLIFVRDIWWIWLPYLLYLVFFRLWMVYINKDFLSKVSWTLLEIKIPPEVGKPPQAMEQVFAGLHGIKSGGNLIDKYWKGKVQLWFSCEIVGRDGAISFFIWTPVQFRNLVEAQVYAQYPESEIREVGDYVEDVPWDIPNAEWNLTGFEMALAKEDAYPIRTYKEFAIQDVQYEEQKVDPLASLSEVLSNLKTGEQIWIQILIRPAGNEWKDKGVELVNKLIGRKKATKKTFGDELLEEFHIYFSLIANALLGSPLYEPKSEEKKDEKSTLMQHLSPGEKEVVAAVERNVSKIGFDTAIRIVYLAKRDVFQPANVAALSGVFNQFNDLTLNSFKRANGTSVDYFFVDRRELQLKSTMQIKYRLREKPGAKLYTFGGWDSVFDVFYKYKNAIFIFNIEELATIFHFPGGVVSTLSLPRVEAKKGAPPINLPLG